MFVHTARRHPSMRRLYDHCYPLRLQYHLNDVGNLSRQSFLDLKSFGEGIDYTRHFRYSDDPSVWKVANVREVGDRGQMMLAE